MNNKFKVGDLVIGIDNVYTYTGKGSINKIVQISEKGERISVRCIWPSSPFMHGDNNSSLWNVVSKHFSKIGDEIK